MIASPSSAFPCGGVAGRPLKDGGVFVRCAFPYKAIVNFLIFESHMLVLFTRVFLWRVRFWLRMNAGGVLNTCKSNGIQAACCLVRVANG